MGTTSGTGSIPGAPDAELGLPRPGPLGFRWTRPEGAARGLVFVIHGFGADAQADYDVKLRAHLAERHGLAAVTVDYHCSQARPETGARIELPDEALLQLQGLLCTLGIHERLSPDTVTSLITRIGPMLSVPVNIRARLRAGDGTLQNFGVIQALDHLHVLSHLRKEGFAFDPSRVLLLGSSHGGYLAHLLQKFAPNTFSGILDNSGYTQANKTFLGLGVEYRKSSGKLSLKCSLASAWTHENIHARDYFGPPREQIRSVVHLPHALASARASRKDCRVRMVNAVQDSISPVGFKRAQRDLYSQTGFDVGLLEFGGGGADPDFVKSMAHADLSLMKLSDRFLPELLEARLSGPPDADLGTALVFECAWLDYRLTHGGPVPSVRLEVAAP
jgi:hypothetical protein